MKEQLSAYVTKYALTVGILYVKGEVNHGISSGMLCYGKHGVAHGKDWHRTADEALARANEMRIAKLLSMRKATMKLEAMVFTVPKEPT